MLCQRLNEFIQNPSSVSMTKKSILGIFKLISEAFGDSTTRIKNYITQGYDCLLNSINCRIGTIHSVFLFLYFTLEFSYQLWLHNNNYSFFSSIPNNKKKQQKTRGPWWSYIAHLTKQICIFTVEVSAKFTALGFLYKLFSTNHPQPPPPHPRPCFFTNLDNLNWILKEGHQRNISAKLYWNWSSGLKSFI